MEQKFEILKQNVDSWIKDIRSEVSKLSNLPSAFSESVNNIEHNYELIYELKDEIEELKQEINSLKLIQLVSIKKEIGSTNIIK